ncbi:MAG: hypothetical protein JWM68_2142 [Verrucomicrobiales bacterium]|nr:hypothetical protein [Verrucomicrobiales bacterium]
MQIGSTRVFMAAADEDFSSPLQAYGAESEVEDGAVFAFENAHQRSQTVMRFAPVGGVFRHNDQAGSAEVFEMLARGA